MKYLVLNHKCMLTSSDARIYADKLRSIPKATYDLIVAPSTSFLPYFEVGSYHLAAQDISRFLEGPYTGEVGAKALASLKVKYAFVGHSERRAYFEESERVFIRKIENALKAGIEVIYFIGETKEERRKGLTLQILEKQIGRVLNDFKREEIKNVMIAYEPIWAVGTGVTPDIKDVEEAIRFIKKIMREYYELDTTVLYGGSITEKNILTYANSKVVDGIIIGSASSNIDVLTHLIATLNF